MEPVAKPPAGPDPVAPIARSSSYLDFKSTQSIGLYTRRYSSIHVHINMYMYVYIYISMCIHIYIYTHMCALVLGTLEVPAFTCVHMYLPLP